LIGPRSEQTWQVWKRVTQRRSRELRVMPASYNRSAPSSSRANFPWGALGIVAESLKSGSLPLRITPVGRREAMPRRRSTVFVSPSYLRLALFAHLRLGEPFGKAQDTTARRFEVEDLASLRTAPLLASQKYHESADLRQAWRCQLGCVSALSRTP